MFNRIRRMTATCHSGHAAQASESAAVPLARRIRVDRSGEVPRVPKPKTLGAVLSKRPETQWRRVHGLPGLPQGSARGTSMRLIVGIIIGCPLAVGAA